METAEDHGPGVLIFPPVLFALTLVTGSVLTWFFPFHFWEATWSRRILGAVLFLAALSFARWGEATMRRAGTNVRPDRPSTAIVEDGPFHYTRNPLYLAVATMFVGLAQMANSAWFLLLLIPMLVLLHFGVVRREERYLEAKFGEDYRAYRARVRRYL